VAAAKNKGARARAGGRARLGPHADEHQLLVRVAPHAQADEPGADDGADARRRVVGRQLAPRLDAVRLHLPLPLDGGQRPRARPRLPPLLVALDDEQRLLLRQRRAQVQRRDAGGRGRRLGVFLQQRVQELLAVVQLLLGAGRRVCV